VFGKVIDEQFFGRCRNIFGEDVSAPPPEKKIDRTPMTPAAS